MNLFSRVGIVLWGDVNAAWAEALGIGERTIRRFRSGDMEPPPGVWREMLIQVQGMRERTCAHAHSSEWAELEDQIKAELRKRATTHRCAVYKIVEWNFPPSPYPRGQ